MSLIWQRLTIPLICFKIGIVYSIESASSIKSVGNPGTGDPTVKFIVESGDHAIQPGVTGSWGWQGHNNSSRRRF